MCSNVDIRNNAIEVPLFIALGEKKGFILMYHE